VPTERDGVLLLRMQTLGAARLQIGTTPLGLNAGMLFALVLRVVYTPGMAVRRATLLRELWPHHGDERRRGSLRQALYKLRSMGLHVSLVGEDVVLDRTQVARTFSVERTSSTFEHDVIRGDEPFGAFVPGFRSPSAAYDQWFDATREGVHADVRRVLVDQLRARRERADWGGAEALARWLLPFDPLNEDATLTLAECTMLSGAKAEAVAILDRYLAELGPTAGDIRLPATQLRKRFTEPGAKHRPSLASMERHFVGRQEELAELTLAMRRARWHDGSAVLLHGPAGIGKTRVLGELSKVAQIEGYLELCLECRESDQRRPLGVVLDLLPELLASPGALGCSPESLGLLKQLIATEEPTSERVSGEVLEERTTRSQAASKSQRTVERSVRHALVDILGAISEERPTLLIAEDTHWIDENSWECLVDLVQRVSSTRLFIVATSRSRFGLQTRPERFPSNLHITELQSLQDQESIALARAIGDDCVATPSPEMEQWFVRASEGNPLMLRSLIYHWVETGDAGGIPPTLQVLLEQRIDRLHPHALRSMQAIVLLGSFASPERIHAVLELPNHELLAALEQLAQGNCLARTENVVAASHELIGRAAIEKLPPLVQASLHSAISDVLLADFARTASTDAMLFAVEHLCESGRVREARERLLSNAARVIAFGLPQHALSILDRAEELEANTIREVGWDRLRGRLELESGEYARALRHAPGGLHLPSSTDGLSSVEVDELLSFADSASRADPIVDRNELATFAGIAASNSTLSADVRIRAAEIGLIIAANTCDSVVAEICFRSVQGALDPQSIDDRTDGLLLLYHTIFGELPKAEEAAQRIIRSGSSSKPSTVSAQAIARAGYALRVVGKHDEARSAFEYALELSLHVGAPRLAQYPAWQLAQLAMDAGDADRLSQYDARLRALVESDSDPIASSFVSAHHCRVSLFRKDTEGAREYLRLTKLTQPRFPTNKAAAYVLALEVGVALLDPAWTPTDAILESCWERHRTTAAFTTSDYLTSVLADSLLRVDRVADSRNLVQRYLATSRRERGRPGAALGSTIAALKLDDRV
jgi:DNA-binding SARP family transcriptional activator/tetratricopeptide (TPR) repeat protein